MARAAAYLAACRLGYPSTALAEALAYAEPSSVTQAVRRIASATSRLSKALQEMGRQLTND